MGSDDPHDGAAHDNHDQTGKTSVPGKAGPTDAESDDSGGRFAAFGRRTFVRAAGAAALAPVAMSGLGSAASGTHELLVLSTANPAELTYEFTTTGEVTKVTAGRNGAEGGNDAIKQNSDGTYTVSGYTGNGFGDTYEFSGHVIAFSASSDDYELQLDGSTVSTDDLITTVHELVVLSTADPSELTYEFSVDGWTEKALDGRNGAEAGNDEVTENSDGTYTVSGYTGNGYGDTYRFVGDVTAFAASTDEYELRLDGNVVSVADLTGSSGGGGSDGGGGSSSGPVIGGGDGYADTVPKSAADVVVSSFSELESALGSASSGDVVYVAGGATIDVGTSELSVPSGVTLASDRGVDGAAGGHVLTKSEDQWPGILKVGDDVRVTGLRVSGPRDEYGPYEKPITSGVVVQGSGVEIDNCELWGFSHAAAKVYHDTHVHHNHVHHNPMAGLGYGVLCKGGHPVVEYNEFNYNRHSVANGGSAGYTVRYNHFGTDTIQYVVGTHRPGGKTLEVHHNTIEATERVQESGLVPAFNVRGVPDDVADVHHNWFYNPEEPLSSPDGWTDEAIVQPLTDSWENVTFSNNHYGSSEPADDVGCPR